MRPFRVRQQLKWLGQDHGVEHLVFASLDD